jgi:transcription initiation factor IIE alpha subunit
MSKKKHIPWFFRRRLSCPDCGWVAKTYEEQAVFEKPSFSCPRCESYFSEYDLMDENMNKWSREADLTYEEI